MLIEEGCPSKIPTLEKVMSFNLLLIYILNDIDICIIGIEYSNKLKAVVTRIEIPLNPVLIMSPYN